MRTTTLAILLACLLLPLASAAAPVANAGPAQTARAGETVQFQGSAVGDIATYSWDFGDGATGAGPRPTHAYARAGVYHAILTVVDSSGQLASDATNVTVLASPPVITHAAVTSGTAGRALALTLTVASSANVTNVDVHYRHDASAAFVAAPASSRNGTFTATIPASDVAPGLEYFLTAIDAGGNVGRAPAAPGTFAVNVPAAAPRGPAIRPLASSALPLGPVSFTVTPGDAAVASVKLTFRLDGATQRTTVNLTRGSDGATWSGTLPGVTAGAKIDYSLVATDAANRTDRRPDAGESVLSFTAAGPASTTPTPAASTPPPASSSPAVATAPRAQKKAPAPELALIVGGVVALALAARRRAGGAR